MEKTFCRVYPWSRTTASAYFSNTPCKWGEREDLKNHIFVGLGVSETDFLSLRLLLYLNKHEKKCIKKDMKEKYLKIKAIAEFLST